MAEPAANSHRPTVAANWPASGWSVAMLRTLLAAKGVPAGADDETALAIAKRSQHKLAATLLSLLAQERELSPTQAAELAAYRRDIEHYRQLATEICGAVRGVGVMKGSIIAALYPEGLLRSSADLDLLCTREQVWQTGALLAEDGWQLSTFSLTPSSRGVEVFVGYEQAGPDEANYEVELKTVDFVSNLTGRQRFTSSWSPLVRSTLALLAERFEQPFRSRDLLDLALLLHVFDADDIQVLRSGLTATRLWAQWWEAGTQLARLRWLPPHAAAIGGQRAAFREQVVRSTSAVVTWLNPATAIPELLEVAVDSAASEWIDRLSVVFHEHGGATCAFAAGRPVYGVSLNNQSSDRLRLIKRGPHLVAATPLGTFLMVVGPAREEWLSQAS